MKVYIIVPLLIGSLFATSRYNGGTRPFDTAVHDTNEVELGITNYGKFGDPCWWPPGSMHGYIFGAGVWFGTVDSATGDTLVTIGYGPHGGESEFGPGLKGMSINHPDAIIFMHPENWPAPDTALPMAPQDTISHEDSWCCMNDCDSNLHVPGDTRPIGIEMYQTGYAWDLPLIDDIVFLTYEIKNVSGHGLYDCYVGIAADNDIGNESGTSANDIISGIVGQWYYIAGESLWVDAVGYQWQTEIEPTPAPPWWPGAIAFDLLQTPFDLVEGHDKDNDGIPDQYEQDSSYYWNNVPPSMWDVDYDNVPDWRDPSENPQHGMTAFKRFTLSSEPNIDGERYLTLAGYDINGQYNPYDTAPPMPDDQRFLMSSGPFDVPVDSSIFMVFAVILTNWDSLQSRPDTAVAQVDKWAQLYYDMYWFLYTGLTEENTHQIEHGLYLMPNPAVGITQVSFTTMRPGLVSVTLYNSIGQVAKKIIKENIPSGVHNIDIHTRNLVQGTYFIVVETAHYKLSRSLVILR